MTALHNTTTLEMHLGGLHSTEVPSLQQQYGMNVFSRKRAVRLHFLQSIILEPMFLLLLFACSLYFLLGSIMEGLMMLAAMLLVTLISVYQEAKSVHALEALKQYTAPLAGVIRDGRETTIRTEELVPGDILLLYEGEMIPADAHIINANDLTVDESLITGESLPVTRPANGHTELYRGSTINSGSCIAQVTATGNNTLIGKLGRYIDTAGVERTLLQQQIQIQVRRLAIFGIIGFTLVFLFNFLRSGDWASSLLLGLTLAMAAIPEEIPVSFSSFIALGAYYMSRMGIIPRQPQIIENLGAASVLCLDKTGTLTENKMKVVMQYDHRKKLLTDMETSPTPVDSCLLYFGMLASERQPFDSMEKAIWEAYQKENQHDTSLPVMVHEYPLEGKPPMMTHVYHKDNIMLAVAKGAVERIAAVCRLDDATIKKLYAYNNEMGMKGYRILGVASAIIADNQLPASQDDADWQLEGLIALYDPPRISATPTISLLYKAGIRVILLTGDHPATSLYIASKVGIDTRNHNVTGEEVMTMSDIRLRQIVAEASIFVRMFPSAKLKVIQALKANGEIVAMTGDGVNDGPAIKAAHIGIAMGKKGTEIARQAADLIITDDDLGRIPVAIEQGRKLYSNLKKAIRYIISIHIPIILVATIPLLAGWKFPNIFTPIHVIFLELIMGPTCSLFYEKEPAENNIMQIPPRDRKAGLFSKQELLISIIMGLTIAGGVLTLYAIYMAQNDLAGTRTIVFTTLLISNIFLTFSYRSFTESFGKTVWYYNPLVPIILTTSLLFIAAIHLVPFVRQILGLAQIHPLQFIICILTGFVTVAWFELFKRNSRGRRLPDKPSLRLPSMFQ